uniref:MYND-type domain-containing protein n=1 Tax=Eimeria tenella TaxID=5802 RepID=H9B9F4_EIMTE|nr:hypothetical protein [Eimeria tenella]
MSLDEVEHAEFKFLLIPYDIDKPVQELIFKGKEASFRDLLKTHLNNEKINCLNKKNFDNFRQELKKKAEGKIDDQGLERVLQGSSQNYQIIPLTLPTKANNFKGINAYIDSVGRIKDIPKNARASRICSTDIRGDCFLSLVYDDEEKFERQNLTLKDFEELMKNPPEATGRWSETQATMQLLQQQSGAAKPEEAPRKPKCENCGKEDLPLKKCSRCSKSFYCSVQCQRKDWPLHKRICSI